MTHKKNSYRTDSATIVIAAGGYSRDGKVRYDRYVPDDSPDNAEINQIFCLGIGDTSRQKSTYPNGYDSRCGCCYLNFGHTEARHNADVERMS